jgi:hypothetical protein
MRHFAFILLLAACSKPAAKACDVDSQLGADLTGTSNVIDCGRVLDDSADGGFAGAMQAGHDCVLAAIKSTSAFRFVYGNGVLTGGISGFPSGSHMFVRWYAASADGKLSMQTCEERPNVPAISPAGACTPAEGVPCLSCNAPIGAILCD